MIKKTRNYECGEGLDTPTMSHEEYPTIEEVVTKKEESPAQEETTGPETINGIIVNRLNVNVRKESDLESEVLEVLRKGDKVTILGKENGFHKVSTSTNSIAYISSDFIKEE